MAAVLIILTKMKNVGRDVRRISVGLMVLKNYPKRYPVPLGHVLIVLLVLDLVALSRLSPLKARWRNKWNTVETVTTRRRASSTCHAAFREMWKRLATFHEYQNGTREDRFDAIRFHVLGSARSLLEKRPPFLLREICPEIYRRENKLYRGFLKKFVTLENCWTIDFSLTRGVSCLKNFCMNFYWPQYLIQILSLV